MRRLAGAPRLPQGRRQVEWGLDSRVRGNDQGVAARSGPIPSSLVGEG